MVGFSLEEKKQMEHFDFKNEAVEANWESQLDTWDQPQQTESTQASKYYELGTTFKVMRCIHHRIIHIWL